MTYQQAGRIAVLKRIAGWVIFIPAVISTLISVLKFMYDHSEKQPGINAVMLDFAHVMIEMMRFNTPFLNVFWFRCAARGTRHRDNARLWSTITQQQRQVALLIEEHAHREILRPVNIHDIRLFTIDVRLAGIFVFDRQG